MIIPQISVPNIGSRRRAVAAAAGGGMLVFAAFRSGSLPSRPAWISTTDETGVRPACRKPQNPYPGVR
jgi:hypothetical protein